MELSQAFISDKPINRICSEQDEENFKALVSIKNEFMNMDLDQEDPHQLITSIESLFKKDQK
jgi:hypothetical protein